MFAVPFVFVPQVHEVPYLLIRDDLSRAFLLHYAQQYRHLASSRQRLAAVSWGGRAGLCGVHQSCRVACIKLGVLKAHMALNPHAQLPLPALAGG